MQLREAGVGTAPLFPSNRGTQVGPRAGLFHLELKFSDFYFRKRDKGKNLFQIIQKLFFTPKTNKKKNPTGSSPELLRMIIAPTLTSSGAQGSSEEFLLHKNNLNDYTDMLDRMTHTQKKGCTR